MVLFPPTLLEELRRLPGASHSFLKQVAGPDGADVRSLVEQAAAIAPLDVATRWADLLGSLDNRRFFQGFGEAAISHLLDRSGWRIQGQHGPGPMLVVRDPQAQDFDLLPLCFVRQARPMSDHAVIAQLSHALDRVPSRSRIAVLVRRWLPHDFDPDPVRRAIDLWLREVDRGGWDGRYAAYDDDNVSLEFALTGERTDGERGVVAFTIGPFDAQRTLEALERRVIFELDTWRMHGQGYGERPVLLACVSDQPWRISDGYLRDLLYAKPVQMSQDPTRPGIELTFGEAFAPSLFRDPLYSHVAGAIMVERPADGPAELHARAWLNPWSKATPSALPCPSLVCDRHDDQGRPVMRWR